MVAKNGQAISPLNAVGGRETLKPNTSSKSMSASTTALPSGSSFSISTRCPMLRVLQGLRAHQCSPDPDNISSDVDSFPISYNIGGHWVRV